MQRQGDARHVKGTAEQVLCLNQREVTGHPRRQGGSPVNKITAELYGIGGNKTRIKASNLVLSQLFPPHCHSVVQCWL